MGAAVEYRKRKYPWRLGATSFVIPDDLLANVRLLSGLVDDVQLLFFESRAKARLPHLVDVGRLQELALGNDLTYTVHLPTDIRLGAASVGERQAGIDEICRLVDELSLLSPLSFDLHLLPETDLAESVWLEHLDHSLDALAVLLGEARAMVGIENIDYHYGTIHPLVERHGFAVCLDLGHLIRYGHNLNSVMGLDFSKLNHIHYHGVSGCRDHGPLLAKQDDVTAFLGEWMAQRGFQGVLTLEMYNIDQLTASLLELDRLWVHQGE